MGKKAAAGAVASFCELHERLSRFGEGWIFRGQADARWELIPKVGRTPYHGHEGYLFNAWKLRAVEHHASHVDSDWDWLAIAQHHGLATRLLDWTTNPLNAAYFAVREWKEVKGPAVIHAARFDGDFNKSAELSFPKPFECDSVAIFRPRGIVPRIIRQGGRFTIHGPPDRALETDPGAVTLERILIAEPYRPKLLVELARYGINSSFLFPDLDGLSSYFNWTVESNEFRD
jgi:hypothetical protein